MSSLAEGGIGALASGDPLPRGELAGPAMDCDGLDCPAAVTLDGVAFRFGRREILDGVDLRVRAGESVAVMGTSGSGKSTLLSLVVGLLRPVSGSVQVLDADLAGLRASRLARFRRRHLGVVFQSGELLPALTAVENTAMPLLLDGASWPVASRTATELLDELGIAQDSQSIPAADLSGGERQRTALARAIVTGAELILADEPTGALDGAARDNVADLLFGLPLDRGCALLVVTHDPAIAARAGRVLALAGGALRPVALAQ